MDNPTAPGDAGNDFGYEGGNGMIRVRRARPESCAHDSTVIVDSAGVRRTVCEACGRVSFAYVADLTGQVERSRFARPADGQEDQEVLGGSAVRA